MPRPISDLSYKRLRVVAKVALGFSLLGAFSLGFRMLGTPDLMQLVLPQMRILQCVAYAIIVAFAVYLSIFEAVLKPIKRKQTQESTRKHRESGTFLPVPSPSASADRPDDITVSLTGMPAAARIVHWTSTEEGTPDWHVAVQSCVDNARLSVSDEQGRASLRQRPPKTYKDNFGVLCGARIHYRVEIEPGVWSEVASVSAE